MTLYEGLSLSVSVGVVVVMVSGGLWVLARNQGAAGLRGDRVDKLGDGEVADARFKGAQEVRNAAAEALAGEVATMGRQLQRNEVAFDRHEQEDDRRFGETGARFDRLEKLVNDGFAHLSAQINNVALGRTGKLFEVKTDGN